MRKGVAGKLNRAGRERQGGRKSTGVEARSLSKLSPIRDGGGAKENINKPRRIGERGNRAFSGKEKAPVLHGEGERADLAIKIGVRYQKRDITGRSARRRTLTSDSKSWWY